MSTDQSEIDVFSTNLLSSQNRTDYKQYQHIAEPSCRVRDSTLPSQTSDGYILAIRLLHAWAIKVK